MTELLGLGVGIRFTTFTRSPWALSIGNCAGPWPQQADPSGRRGSASPSPHAASPRPPVKPRTVAAQPEARGAGRLVRSRSVGERDPQAFYTDHSQAQPLDGNLDDRTLQHCELRSGGRGVEGVRFETGDPMRVRAALAHAGSHIPAPAKRRSWVPLPVIRASSAFQGPSTRQSLHPRLHLTFVLACAASDLGR